MEKFSLYSPSSTIPPFLSPLPISTARRNLVSFNFKVAKKLSVSASKDDEFKLDIDTSKFNQWELMEFKFGRMLGEDPKLTLAKIMERKVNPDASYVEIEKNFYKNKGKLVEVKEVPFDVPRKAGATNVANELNLVRPVPKKGVKVGSGDNSNLPEIKKPSGSVVNKQPSRNLNVPNVILRKPAVYNEKDDEVKKSLGLSIRPNLSLKMREEPLKEKFSGMTLLKKPESVSTDDDVGNKNGSSSNAEQKTGHVGESISMDGSGISDKSKISVSSPENSTGNNDEVTLLEKPSPIMSWKTEENSSESVVFSNGMAGSEEHLERAVESDSGFSSRQREQEEGSKRGMQQIEHNGMSSSDMEVGLNPLALAETGSSLLSVESVLQGKPKRLDQPQKAMSKAAEGDSASVHPEGVDCGDTESSSVSPPLKELEEADWARAEELFKCRDRQEVELISCSTRGYVVSYGSLIGFLPYRNLAAKWRFLAFESWLRKKGLDPAKYRNNLGFIESIEVRNENTFSKSSEASKKAEVEVTADMELEELFTVYNQEKIEFLSSFVGQKIKVNVFLADKKSRKLIFSMRPKENEQMIEKKRNLMAKLSIGDVAKCCIKKITYFGIFVEVEGVPALIHQSEVSWDAALDPTSFLKIGQVVEAKVHQLDFALERIFLSLKEITPDPLNEVLECIVGDHNALNGELQAAQTDSEWAEVDSLVKELQQIQGVQTVSKGRFFLSPGLAPTFQVYMASMFENQYKLLARSGNKVQEVMVQASLGKEEMKSAVLVCTNRVEA